MPITPQAESIKNVTAALKAMTEELRRTGLAAATTAGILGATLQRTAKLYSPAEAIRFEYRLRDLGAVVGSVLAPAFNRLSDQVEGFSRWLYNLNPIAKGMINTFAGWITPITAAGLAVGGLTALLRPLFTVGSGALKVISALRGGSAASAAAGAVATGGVAAAAKMTPAAIRRTKALQDAADAAHMQMLHRRAQTTAPGIDFFGHDMGVPSPERRRGGRRWSGRRMAGAAAGLGLAGAGIAGAVATSGASEEGGILGGALSGGMTGAGIGSFLGPKGAAIGALGGAIIGGLTGWFSSRGTGSSKDPTGLAPREVSTMTSVLDPGRKLRESALMTAGPGKAWNMSNDPADKIAAVLKAQQAETRGFWSDFINELKGEFGGRRTQ